MARKKPSLILKTDCSPRKEFGDYEYQFYGDIVEGLAKRGLTTDDIIGKKIGISFRSGCKRKLKSFRFSYFRSIVRCTCCGPVTEIG